MQDSIAGGEVGPWVVLLQLQPHHVLSNLHLGCDVSAVHHLVQDGVCRHHTRPHVEVEGGAGEGYVGHGQNYFMILWYFHCPAYWQTRADACNISS